MVSKKKKAETDVESDVGQVEDGVQQGGDGLVEAPVAGAVGEAQARHQRRQEAPEQRRRLQLRRARPARRQHLRAPRPEKHHGVKKKQKNLSETHQKHCKTWLRNNLEEKKPGRSSVLKKLVDQSKKIDSITGIE